MGDIHSSQSPGRNGSPDVSADTVGNVHICYGAEIAAAVNNKPSVRYVRYESNTMVRHMAVTAVNELEPWKEENGWGLGSVAASNSGKYVMIAYLTKDEGTLYTRFSSNHGANWSDRTWIEDGVGGSLGRDNHLVRAYRNHFYLVYPANYVYLRILRDVGDNTPAAVSGGPYTGVEGSPVALDMSSSTDLGENSGIVEYAWDWEADGIFDFTSTENHVEVVFNDDFSGTSVLRVKDRAGKTDMDTTTIVINNLPPVLALGGPLTGLENSVFHFSCTVSDPGSGDTNTITWDLRDGFSVQQNPVDHLYRDGGTFLPAVLDNFVSDPDNSDPSLVWTVHGYHDLLVTLTDRVLVVAVPDSEWSG